jgi:Tfp pilus assembly protein PilO
MLSLRRLTDYFVCVPPLYLYVATLFLLIVLVMCWRTYIFVPLVVREGELVHAIGLLEKKRQRIPNVVRDIDATNVKNAQLHNIYKSTLLQHPVQDIYLQFERMLYDIDNAGLRLVSFYPQDSLKKSFYEKHEVALNVTGSFDHIMSFLAFLEQQATLAVCKKASVKKVENNLFFDATICLYCMERDG